MVARLHREEHFKRFRSSNDTEEVNVKIDGIKKQLTKLIVDEFTEVWEDMDVDDTLRRLEAMKQVANNEDAWRPTGKSVAEQTKFYRIQLLQGQIDYFEPKIMKQQEVLKVFQELRCMHVFSEHQFTFRLRHFRN